MAGLSSFLALSMALALWLVLKDGEYVAPAPDGPATGIQPAGAAAALGQLATAVGEGDEGAAADLAPPGDPTVGRRLRALVRVAGEIPVRDVSARYLGELGGLDEDGEWPAAASLSWRFGGADEVASEAEIEVRFAVVDGEVAIASVGGGHGRRPLWLTGGVEVRRGSRTLVVASDRAAYYERLARRAVVVVRRVVPGWRSPLVIEVPGSARALDRALGAEPGSFENVAGVTAAPGEGESAAHVFLNPERLATLQPRGAQVVVSHEAAHVALGATASATTLPEWLSEGFADYVALRDVPLPLSTTAAQIVKQVRREGAPSALPDEADFDEESEYFGAAYEASWLACRMLAKRVGEARLLRFYRRAGETSDFSGLFRASFGLDVAAFTRQWRRSLSDLAE